MLHIPHTISDSELRRVRSNQTKGKGLLSQGVLSAQPVVFCVLDVRPEFTLLVLGTAGGHHHWTCTRSVPEEMSDPGMEHQHMAGS